MKPVPSSLRGRITTAAVAIVGAVLTLAAVLVFTVQRGQLIQSIDNSLDREAGEIAVQLNDPEGATIGDRSDDRFVQILRSDQSIVAGSSDGLRQTPVLDPATVNLDEDGLQFISKSQLPIEDDDYRVLVRQMEVNGEIVLVLVGENTDDLGDSLRVLGLSLAITVPIATALLGAVAWLLVNRTLAPVSAIQNEVGRITGDHLDGRVPVPDTDDEIAELATTMNAMLDRIDNAHARQQHFVADASHELRSPITRLRTSLEVDLAAADRDLNVTGYELLEDIEDLQTLVDDLLFLARTGHEPAPVRRPLDFDAVIDRVVGRIGPTARVPIDTRDVEAIETIGNERHLTRLVTNLLTNAIRHANSQVWLSTDIESGHLRFEMHDDGPGVPAADRQRVFERFTRIDESRTSATGGAGLGLAIVQDIVDAHHGRVHIGDSHRGGAVVVVLLPAVDQPVR